MAAFGWTEPAGSPFSATPAFQTFLPSPTFRFSAGVRSIVRCGVLAAKSWIDRRHPTPRRRPTVLHGLSGRSCRSQDDPCAPGQGPLCRQHDTALRCSGIRSHHPCAPTTVQSRAEALTLPPPAGLIARCLAAPVFQDGQRQRSRFRHLDRRWAVGANEGSE